MIHQTNFSAACHRAAREAGISSPHFFKRFFSFPHVHLTYKLIYSFSLSFFQFRRVCGLPRTSGYQRGHRVSLAFDKLGNSNLIWETLCFPAKRIFIFINYDPKTILTHRRRSCSGQKKHNIPQNSAWYATKRPASTSFPHRFPNLFFEPIYFYTGHFFSGIRLRGNAARKGRSILVRFFHKKYRLDSFLIRSWWLAATATFFNFPF